MRRTARQLHDKSLSSLRRGVRSYNDLDDDGRVTTVLLHMQHAFEMLLKAALEQRRIDVVDPETGWSEGMERCINLAQEPLRLTEAEKGTIRTIDALRDTEQHWFAEIDEGLLYAHIVAGVSLFASLLGRAFDGEEIREHLPARVLPIATEPMRDVQFFIDRQFDEIKRLLAPGSRRQAEARANIRTLLALEAHVDPETDISEKDVRRVVRGVRKNKTRSEVFPRLATLSSVTSGEAIELRYRFARNDEDAIPMKFVPDAAPGGEFTAVRERDLRDRYRWSITKLNKKFGLGTQKGKALRDRAGIDDEDDRYRHVFTFGKSKHPRYSDDALESMKRTLDEFGIDEIWEDYKAQRQP